MGAIKDHAKQILAADIAVWRGIPIEAADDLLDHVQELIFDFRGGMGAYESEEQILTDFGIQPCFIWIFE